ncbi:MAG: hypothetical protein HPY71_14790, partial [Firmicutes bacterium]|nr:hypothetical protein [Bacillota bacterium]
MERFKTKGRLFISYLCLLFIFLLLALLLPSLAWGRGGSLSVGGLFALPFGQAEEKTSSSGDGAPHNLYFAEGYTGRDVFEEYLTLMNPNLSPARVIITYMFRDGTTQEQVVDVGPTTRETVMVNNVVGPDREVS